MGLKKQSLYYKRLLLPVSRQPIIDECIPTSRVEHFPLNRLIDDENKYNQS